MPDRVFQQAYREAMGNFLKPLGFRRKGQSWWRLSQGILQCIGLDRADSGAFTADVWVQPLVYRTDHFILTLGGRLDSFSKEIPFRWDFQNSSQLQSALTAYCGALHDHVLPWFSRLDSYTALVQTEKIQAWPFVIVQNRSKPGMIGYSALAIQDYEYGNLLLEQVCEYLHQVEENYNQNYHRKPPDWINAELSETQNLLKLLRQAEYDKLRSVLRNNEEYTIDHLRLDISPFITV